MTVYNGGIRFTVNVTDTETTRVLDKTWQEIHDAFVSGLACIIHREFKSGTYTLNYENMIVSVRYGISASEEDEYMVFHTDTEFGEFSCNSPTDYPYIEL